MGPGLRRDDDYCRHCRARPGNPSLGM